GWWKRSSNSIEEDEDDADNYGEISMITAKNNSLPSFSRLSILGISGCPKLSSMPLFPYLEMLDLDKSNLRLLERTISMGMISTVSQENPTAAAVAESTSSAPSSSSILAASFTPLSKLKSLGIGMIEGSNDHFLQHFTALEVLSLYNYNGDEMELEWQGLRKLQRLRLYDHPKLASLPVGLQQATSLRNLHIWNCPSLTTLPEWICEIISLQSLYIFDCPNLTSLPALTSLKTLEIRHCPNLTSLPALTSLKTLEIRRLYNYNGDGMELEWQGLRKLQYLRLFDHPKLASLPATSLRKLEISNCLSLTTLPEWICEIISLQSLRIWECPNLTSLPALTSLKKLDIQSCPILVESCKSQDWLAHIENLRGDLAPPKEEDPVGNVETSSNSRGGWGNQWGFCNMLEPDSEFSATLTSLDR
ncbi:disease resistance protein rpp5, partial [Quercus suber]